LPDLGFLHTAEVHVDTFETLALAKALSTQHRVHESWLQQASSTGLDSSLRDKITRELKSLRHDCDVVICTCSTLGELAAQFDDSHVFRVDAPMMAQAAAIAASGKTGAITLLAYCLESTRVTSTQLLANALHEHDQKINIREVDCKAAWPHFEDGNSQRFGETIAAQIEACTISATDASEEVASVVLAQASMTAALPYLGQSLVSKVLSSPANAISHAQTLVHAARS